MVDSPREIALISITTFTAVRQFRYRFIGDHVTQIRAPYPCAPTPLARVRDTRGRCEVCARALSPRVYVYATPAYLPSASANFVFARLISRV